MDSLILILGSQDKNFLILFILALVTLSFFLDIFWI